MDLEGRRVQDLQGRNSAPAAQRCMRPGMSRSLDPTWQHRSGLMSLGSESGDEMPVRKEEWKVFAGRTGGRDGYQFGDLSRGLFRSISERGQRKGRASRVIEEEDERSAEPSSLPARVPPSVDERSAAPSSLPAFGTSKSERRISRTTTEDPKSSGATGPSRLGRSRSLAKSVQGLLGANSDSDEDVSIGWRTMFKRMPKSDARKMRPVRIKDLEPVTSSGQPLREWSRLAALGGLRAGHVVENIPNEACIGEGAYGTVWRAGHRLTKEQYAVKNIKLPNAGGDRELAKREREIAECVILKPHPCIVALFEVHYFRDNHLCSLVMELCPGGDLLARIMAVRREAKRRKQAYACQPLAHAWLGQIYLGLEHLHRMDLLLRDLKPENVVFAIDGSARLTDFGFGRVGTESSGKWTFEIPCGSPGYCAPEIYKMESYDYRADLYSFAVLTWVLLTGGITTCDTPCAPMNRGKTPQDFAAHTNDWHLLALCVSKPEQHHALPLKPVPKAFIQNMICVDPCARLSHDGVRSHSFMSTLLLPAADAPTDELLRWRDSAVMGTVGSLW